MRNRYTLSGSIKVKEIYQITFVIRYTVLWFMSVVRACGPLERPREIYDARQKLSAPVSAVDDNGPPCGVPLEGSTLVTMSPRVAQGNSKFSFRGCPTNYSNFPLAPPPSTLAPAPPLPHSRFETTRRDVNVSRKSTTWSWLKGCPRCIVSFMLVDLADQSRESILSCRRKGEWIPEARFSFSSWCSKSAV